MKMPSTHLWNGLSVAKWSAGPVLLKGYGPKAFPGKVLGVAHERRDDVASGDAHVEPSRRSVPGGRSPRLDLGFPQETGQDGDSSVCDIVDQITQDGTAAGEMRCVDPVGRWLVSNSRTLMAQEPHQVPPMTDLLSNT